MSASDIPAWLPAVARGAGALIRVLGRTWRIEYADGFHALDAEIHAGRRCIFACWHSRLFPLAYSHRGRGVAVLVSRHRDGEWIAGAAEALGFRIARGSSTRGGEAGVLEMLDFAERGHLLGITPDGPRGPAGKVKPGLLYVASRTGWPVVPIAAAADRAWVVRSWDAFRVPQPMARVRVAYGDPIPIPRDLDEDRAESMRQRVEQAIESLTTATATAVGEPT